MVALNGKSRQVVTGGSGNVDNSGRTIDSEYNRLLAEYQARDWSVALDNGEAGGENEADERTAQRFKLLRVLLADKQLTSAANIKVLLHLLFVRYNDRTGRCDPGAKDIATHTGLTVATVRKATKWLREVGGYLIYDENQGGAKSDTNQYSFQFPPLSKSIGVRCPPDASGKGTPIQSDSTPIEMDRRTPIEMARHPYRNGYPNNNKHQSEPSIENSNVPLPSVADTLPCQSGSKVQEVKEGSKRTSEEANNEVGDLSQWKLQKRLGGTLYYVAPSRAALRWFEANKAELLAAFRCEDMSIIEIKAQDIRWTNWQLEQEAGVPTGLPN
jgi:hypothetical protein